MAGITMTAPGSEKRTTITVASPNPAMIGNEILETETDSAFPGYFPHSETKATQFVISEKKGLRELSLSRQE
jgi:hypothetical protein